MINTNNLINHQVVGWRRFLQTSFKGKPCPNWKLFSTIFCGHSYFSIVLSFFPSRGEKE